MGGERGNPGRVEASNQSLEGRQEDRRLLFGARLQGALSGLETELRAGGRLGRLALSWDARDPLPQDERSLFLEARGRRLWGSHLFEVGARIGHDVLTTPFAEHASVTKTRTFGQPVGALFVSAELSFGDLILAPVARADWVDSDFGLSPRLGASWRLPRGFVLQANAGRSFRAPSMGELHFESMAFSSNPNLVSERAWFGDLAVARARGLITGSLGAFVSRYDDLIVYELGSLGRARPFNVGRANITGGEAQLGLHAGPWRAQAAYTLTLATNRTGDERYFDRELPYHPPHKLHLRTEGRWDRFFAVADAEFQAAQFTNPNAIDRAPATRRVDLAVGAAVERDLGLWISAGIRNLLDDQTQTFFGYPLPGRSFWLTLRYDPPLPPTKEATP